MSPYFLQLQGQYAECVNHQQQHGVFIDRKKSQSLENLPLSIEKACGNSVKCVWQWKFHPKSILLLLHFHILERRMRKKGKQALSGHCNSHLVRAFVAVLITGQYLDQPHDGGKRVVGLRFTHVPSQPGVASAATQASFVWLPCSDEEKLCSVACHEKEHGWRGAVHKALSPSWALFYPKVLKPGR